MQPEYILGIKQLDSNDTIIPSSIMDIYRREPELQKHFPSPIDLSEPGNLMFWAKNEGRRSYPAIAQYFANIKPFSKYTESSHSWDRSIISSLPAIPAPEFQRITEQNHVELEEAATHNLSELAAGGATAMTIEHLPPMEQSLLHRGINILKAHGPIAFAQSAFLYFDRRLSRTRSHVSVHFVRRKLRRAVEIFQSQGSHALLRAASKYLRQELAAALKIIRAKRGQRPMGTKAQNTMKASDTLDSARLDETREAMLAFNWYHTINLGNGVITPGEYDHRPLLKHYGIPDDLRGETVLDIGPGHGFFAFEFEKRGAARVATSELPSWTDHDASPFLRAQWKPNPESDTYHLGALGFARSVLNSKVERIFCNIYDVGPKTTGIFDLVFCGSLLLHLTDPIRAMYAIRSATREMAIIATGIDPTENSEARALFHGTVDGQAFWMPNMTCLVRWALAAGFKRVERVSTFSLVSVDGKINTPHGTIKAFVE